MQGSAAGQHRTAWRQLPYGLVHANNPDDATWDERKIPGKSAAKLAYVNGLSNTVGLMGSMSSPRSKRLILVRLPKRYIVFSACSVQI